MPIDIQIFLLDLSSYILDHCVPWMDHFVQSGDKGWVDALILPDRNCEMDIDRVEGRFVLVDADNAYTEKIYKTQYINIRL